MTGTNENLTKIISKAQNGGGTCEWKDQDAKRAYISYRETGEIGPPENLQDQLVEQIIANLRRVSDPEINLNVYDLGLYIK